MKRVATASSSQLAADAGRAMAEAGGNAVDAAIAACLVQLVTEPGVVSLAAGALLLIWPPEGEPIMVDGASEMPGRGLPPDRFGQGGLKVVLDYGGGTPTTVGYGSVATPGALAGLDLAARQFGRLPWRDLVEPAYRHARDGFPLPRASHDYLVRTHAGIFGWNPISMRALLGASGALKSPGETVRIDALSESLRTIADQGVQAFYRGDLARRIASDIGANGGIVTLADFEAYEPRMVRPLEVLLDNWHVATTAAPSLGGAALAAMLLLMRGRPRGAWSVDEINHLIDVQRRVLQYRRDRLDAAEDLDAEVQRLLEQAVSGDADALRAPSTVHTSAIDSCGLACAITASAGYGSGVMPPGTGIWMNNCLGEAELNKRGFHAWPPGSRILTNMAPTVARSDKGEVLAVGSPGADRITTAMLQTILNFVHLRMPLVEAVNHPRLHVEWLPDSTTSVAYEPGLEVDALQARQRRFDRLDMFFGGVSAVHFAPPDRFEVAADIRRTGGTAIGTCP